MDPHALEIPGGFDHQPRTRLVYGPGALAHLGAVARQLEARRALIVTGEHLVAEGYVDRARASLDAAGVAAAVWAEVHHDPDEELVAACAEHARGVQPDLWVGLGGGSSIDTAKGANFLLSGGGTMEDYLGAGTARGPMLPLVAVPTTAGTGSEVQSFALIERSRDGQKMACGDPRAAPRAAILDPELTASMPRHVAACTGLDALGHAIEAAVTRAGNEISHLYAREAFRLAITSFEPALQPGASVEVRGAMLRAAAFAGLAIEASMLGAAHSMANPLTARFELAHGQAVAMALPHVVRFNAEHEEAAEVYRQLAVSVGLATPSDDPRAAAEALARRLDQLVEVAGFPPGLRHVGVDEARLDELAAHAAQQWTAQFNPRAVAEADLRRLYERALG